MKTIKRHDLVKMLQNLSGTKIVTLVVETDPGKKKYKGRFIKKSKVNGVINWIYSNAVNKQRTKEGKPANFSSHMRRWGFRIPKTPFVEHNGNQYLELKLQHVYKTQYFHKTGFIKRRINPSDFSDMLQTDKSPTNQGIENPIVLKDYRLDRIREITIDKETYKVI